MTVEAAPQVQVTVHYAQSLDGRIATRTGHSRWISGDDTLRYAHELRAGHKAVMVGAGTVCHDDPRLTVRLAKGPNPLRVVVDSTLRLPLDAQLLTDGAAPTLIATTDRAARSRIDAIARPGVSVVVVGQDSSGHVSLPRLLSLLAARGITSVLIEGGAALITSALRDRIVDRLTVCIAPKIIGSGIEAVGDLAISRMDQALDFAESSFVCTGEDVVFDGRLKRPVAAR
ncbi:MAG TPA: RibD family protein [Chloroflexota bacterium]|nr:RibD family protein [Chloroflexota bacterium]